MITVGDELVSRQYQNTNLQEISQILKNDDEKPSQQFVYSDNLRQISETIIQCIDQTKFIIVNGSLGPTSDDKIRYAVSVQKSILCNEQVWKTVQQQLTKLSIELDLSSARQAFFPAYAKILGNVNGIAAGFYLQNRESHIIVFPETPTQFLPMLQAFLQQISRSDQLSYSRYEWILIMKVKWLPG